MQLARFRVDFQRRGKRRLHREFLAGSAASPRGSAPHRLSQQRHYVLRDKEGGKRRAAAQDRFIDVVPLSGPAGTEVEIEPGSRGFPEDAEEDGSGGEGEREGEGGGGGRKGGKTGRSGVAEIHAEMAVEGDLELVDGGRGEEEVSGEEECLGGGGREEERGKRGNAGAAGGGVAGVPFGGVGAGGGKRVAAGRERGRRRGESYGKGGEEESHVKEMWREKLVEL